MNSAAILVLFIQSIVIMLVAPLTIGIVRRVKAWYQNRHGAGIFQPYWALATFVRKEMTIPKHSSWVFRFVPYAVLSATLALAWVVPSIALGVLPMAASNIFLITALAALASVFLVFGGMDTGSTFGNMGSNREITLVALAESAFFIVLATFALLTGSANLNDIIKSFAAEPFDSTWLMIIPTLGALLLVTLAENARYPVDNPATHLELTMVHEAMILEYSGPYLGALEYASALRLTAFGILFMNLVFPFGLVSAGASISSFLFAFIALVFKLSVFAFLVASIESLIVKMRFYRMQEYFGLTLLLALIGVALVLTSIF